MSAELSGTYDPQSFEDRIYKNWLEKGYFKSRVSDKPPYTIVIPPPNVTGMLHMGHILNNTIQDILIRYKRMDGFEACWIPGTDHASIATESKVVKYLAGKDLNKEELGRDKFLEYAYEWKDKYGGIIISQLKKLGASCDWDRERFTMDNSYYRSVVHSFVDLFKKGYIYKGYRLVNWCPVSKSAISDEEVYYKEIEGHLWHFRYPVKGSDEFVVVATTRPETMLGDTAVAVNPKDNRYTHLVGKTVILPIVNREIPIIADDYVDMEFGTGVVKITPAHDPNDYEIGKRHDLQFINILNDDASLNNKVPEGFRDLDRYEAREAVIQKLEELKCLVKIENYTHKVGYSERGHVPIEPYLSEQWFMKMGELVKPAIDVVKDKKINFYPERWTKTYFHWLENIRDWCISRQLWWGHRIPVWYCDECGFYSAYEEAPHQCEKCGSTHLHQDSDVLDTWSSSWLWPFAVHSWPDVDEELKYYYPTNTLVTGPDIIFFWVARMIIAGMEFMGEIPFDRVYFTGIIRDEQGRKMSKSLGNSPDPLDVIAEFGADALRYTMIRLAPLGNDILYSNEKCELGRNFANKLWNAARFLLSNLEGIKKLPFVAVKTDVFDRWILSRLQSTIDKVRDELERFHFNDYTTTLYDFIWGEFCAWYIEVSKVALYSGNQAQKEAKISVLLHVLEESLKLLHPVMPYITEELYHALPDSAETIMTQAFPKSDDKLRDAEAKEWMTNIMDVIYSIRNVRGENKIQPHLNVTVRLSSDSEQLRERVSACTAEICKLAKLESLEVLSSYEKQKTDAVGVGQGFEVFLSLEGLIDFDKERKRLTKEMERVKKGINAVSAKLNNQNFVSRAPEAVVQKERQKLQVMQEELEKLKHNFEALEN